MRKTHDSQLKLGQVPIAEITFDPRDRDDIPAALKGLQAVYLDETARSEIFEILEKRLLPKVSLARGRPGMNLWCIFVLGVLKQALDCDFDRLKNLACSHIQLRQMLGHSDLFDLTPYRLQTIIDNVSLLTEEVLREINMAVVRFGHRLLKADPAAPLHCRADSSVTKTNVHWPTDVNLLRDAVTCMIRTLHRTCDANGIPGWRKHRDWKEKVRKAFNRVSTARTWRRERKVKAYLALCQRLVVRVAETVAVLQERDIAVGKIVDYMAHAVRQIDQVERRLIKKETIPHHEKVFSIHEPHTRWICKGKAGVKAELGLPVCVLEDQHQLILHHAVLHAGVDSDMIVSFIAAARRRWPSIASCSLDKGYYTPRTKEVLDGMLVLNAMPRKGRWTKADRERETAPAFVKARKQHPRVASAINNLNHRGLVRLRTHGVEGFNRTVALAVVAGNVHRLGKIVRALEEKREHWYAARRKAA